MSTVNVTKDVKMDTINQNKNRTGRDSITKTRRMVMTAMLGTIASILMFFDFPIPMLIPGFIKLDFSELPALIASFTLGPVSGIVVCLIKNLVNCLSSYSVGIGELCNFLLGVAFVLPAGLIYQKKKNFKGAMIASMVGCVCIAAFSVPINYFLVYPAYAKFMPMESIIEEYQAINPNVNGLLEVLVLFNMPFTFFKGLCNVVITFLIYKPLSPIIKGFR